MLYARPVRDVTNLHVREADLPAADPINAQGAAPRAVLEAELLALRTAAAEVRRGQAAIVLERARIDAERTDFLARIQAAVAEATALRSDLESAAAATASERAAWHEERATRHAEHAALQTAWVQERATLEARRLHAEWMSARAQRWSPRHHAGRLLHRSAWVRRSRSGQAPG